MKLVKKILRLLPFILMLFMFIFSCFAVNQKVEILFETSGFVNIFEYFLNSLDELFMNMGLPFFSIFDIYPNLANFIYNTFNLIETSFFSFDIVISIMCYELFLSLIFLFFDFINMVFNWTNKLIHKGGNLDD